MEKCIRQAKPEISQSDLQRAKRDAHTTALKWIVLRAGDNCEVVFVERGGKTQALGFIYRIKRVASQCKSLWFMVETGLPWEVKRIRRVCV